MKVVMVLGSPRKISNSTMLAEVVAKTVMDQGGSVQSYVLNKLQFRGCQACSACKGQSESCVLKDDLQPVLSDIITTDILILATPVYWGDVSGQMKLFIDRTYSYLKPGFMEREDKHRLPPGKRLVWIQSQGADNDEVFAGIYHRYNMFFDQLQYFTERYQLIASGVNNGGEVVNRPDLISRAEEIGQKLATTLG